MLRDSGCRGTRGARGLGCCGSWGAVGPSGTAAAIPPLAGWLDPTIQFSLFGHSARQEGERRRGGRQAGAGGGDPTGLTSHHGEGGESGMVVVGEFLFL